MILEGLLKNYEKTDRPKDKGASSNLYQFFAHFYILIFRENLKFEQCCFQLLLLCKCTNAIYRSITLPTSLLSGELTTVRVNMLIRSMGPISETDMVHIIPPTPVDY